ncbi:hypothetical protein GCM10011575_36210 [Microlunatus endophyticus]|uniref:Glyoxalase-like domain-containing protein n=1 Tax=Microlunatus endophyticus TaxID=1716077 RepID=A0A917SEK0_9ACTN|nr:VOC family protein [Microlunatus endophyticus]GGL74760.1 hypothetical protein GCM10011575_36210 [Microlunatus endophyticus]
MQVDARDAHIIADFWIAALGYELEDNTAFVEDLVRKGVVPAEQTFRRPDGVLSFTGFEAIRGGGPRILFHTVPEEKSIKNRLHLDINVGKDRMHGEAERLVGLGATLLREIEDPSGHWIAMLDPEGNEFDLQ